MAWVCVLGFWVRISPGAWLSQLVECCMLSGRGLCDGLITRPEESYRLRYVVVCDLETSRMRRPWPASGRSATGGGSVTLMQIVCWFYEVKLLPKCERRNKKEEYKEKETEYFVQHLKYVSIYAGFGRQKIPNTSVPYSVFWRCAKRHRT